MLALLFINPLDLSKKGKKGKEEKLELFEHLLCARHQNPRLVL